MLLQWKQRNKSVWGDFILHFELYSEWERQNSIFIVTSPGKAQDRRKRNLLNRRRAEDKHENFTFKASLFLSKKSNFSWAQKGSSSKEELQEIGKKWTSDGSLLLWRENFAWRGKSSSSPKKTISCPGMPKPLGQWRAGITPGFFSDFSLQDFSQDFPTQHFQALWRCYNFTQDLCTPGSCSGEFLQTLLIRHIQDENK